MSLDRLMAAYSKLWLRRATNVETWRAQPPSSGFQATTMLLGGGANDHAIDIIPARSNYAIGDVAQVLIASPFQGATQALVSIERGDVLSVERLDLHGTSHIYEFEILPQHAPNIFVSVFLLKPADELGDVVDWRLGLTELRVEPERGALNIDIEADRAIAAPGETVRYRLRVTDHTGEPVSAEVGLGLTDLSALSLEERNSPPLQETFFGPQALSVRTSSSLTLNAHATALAQSEGKGGDGGIFDAGIVELKGGFIETPYWNPNLTTDEAGEATVDIRLPDNQTTWRLDARAWTAGRRGDLLVGEQTHDLLSAKPLRIRPVTPRYFTVGDRAQLAAVINNNTGDDVSARVTLEQATGLVLPAGSEYVQSLAIAAGGRERVSWLVEVEDVPSVAPRFVVRSDDEVYTDASISPVSADLDGTLPVYRYVLPETVSTAGVLRGPGSRTEALLLPRDVDVYRGALKIRIDKSLAGLTIDSLRAYEAESDRYRECVSTVVSRFLPNVVAYSALSRLGVADLPPKSKLDALVSEGMQVLYSRQLAGGGWSWCGYALADTMTSAYALVGLSQAAAHGYPVDVAVVERAQDYLSNQLITSTLQVEAWQLNRQAFLLYALAQSGAPDIARTVTLFESRHRMNLDAIAFLAQALYRINPDDRLRLTALARLMHSRAVTRASGAFFEENIQDRRIWSSSVRSTALALDTLVKLQPDSELLPNFVRYLVSARSTDWRWSSPQEHAWATIALTNWMLASDEPHPSYAYSIRLNDDLLRSDVAQSDNARYPMELRVNVRQLIQREANMLEFHREGGLWRHVLWRAR